MTNQELVEWNNKSLQEPLQFGGGEEWISKRKVATITKKNIEKSVKRQVVLEDGRIIEEDAPEVTVDTIEDTRTNENESNEDKNILPDSDLNRIVDRYWTPGDKILSEKQEQNINTQDMSERTTTSAAGYNMGDLRSSDLEKVLRQGRSVKSVITPYESDQNSLAIPVTVTSKSSHRNRRVDKENIHEIQRIHGDKLRTDRFVTKEMAEDRGSESPAGGDESTEETESRDGDKRQFSRRKEDRYIDYYKVPKGKTINEGTKLGRGIHMTSHDTDDRPVPTPRRDKSLSYEKRQSKSTETRLNRYPDARLNRPPETRLNNKRWSIASSSQDDTPSRIPDHLDRERLGRVKRSMSFQSKETPFLSNGLREKPRKSKSFLGSLKSLYSSVLLLPQHPKEHDNYDHQRERIEKANKDWFENGNYENGSLEYEQHPPQRPPRKYKSGQNINNMQESSKKSQSKFPFISTTNLEMKSPFSTLERGRRHSRPKIEHNPRRDDSASSHRSKNRSSPSRHHHHHHHHRESPSGSRHHSNKGSPNVSRHHGYRNHYSGDSRHHSPSRLHSNRESPIGTRHHSNRESPIGTRHHSNRTSPNGTRYHNNRESPIRTRHQSNRDSPSSSLDRKYRASPHHNRSGKNSPISTLERSRKKRPTVVVPNIGTGVNTISQGSSPNDRNRYLQDYNTASLDRRKPERKTHSSRITQDNYFSLDRKTHKKHKDPRFPSSTLGRISKSLQNSFHRIGSSSPPRHPPPPPPTSNPEPHGYHHMKRNSTDSAGSARISNNSNGIQRRQTFSTYDYNRETPRFEPERQQRRYGSRYFGQDDDSEVDVRERPPPDMRRLLLNGVNESRRNAMNKEIESKSIPIRAV